MSENGGKVSGVASGVIAGLKGQPLALALIVVNVLYLAAGSYLLIKISDRSAQRDNLIVKLADRDCGPARARGAD